MWIDNLRSDFEHLGVAKTVARAGYKLANRIGHLDLFRLMELNAERVHPDSVSAAACAHYDCRFASRDDLATMPAQFGPVLTSEYVAAALSGGDECFAIFDGPRCAAFGWYSRRPTIIRDTLVLHFDPAWIYMYHGYTAPDHRGRKLHALGIGRAMQAYAERGVKGMISIAEQVNYRTHNSAYRMGFVDRGAIWRIGVGSLSRIGQSRSCDAYGVRVKEAAASAGRT